MIKNTYTMKLYISYKDKLSTISNSLILLCDNNITIGDVLELITDSILKDKSPSKAIESLIENNIYPMYDSTEYCNTYDLYIEFERVDITSISRYYEINSNGIPISDRVEVFQMKI